MIRKTIFLLFTLLILFFAVPTYAVTDVGWPDSWYSLTDYSDTPCSFGNFGPSVVDLCDKVEYFYPEAFGPDTEDLYVSNYGQMYWLKMMSSTASAMRQVMGSTTPGGGGSGGTTTIIADLSNVERRLDYLMALALGSIMLTFIDFTRRMVMPRTF